MWRLSCPSCGGSPCANRAIAPPPRCWAAAPSLNTSQAEGMTVTTVDAIRPVTGGIDTHPDLNVAPCLVTGGVDTHLDLNVAAALEGIGGLLGVAEFPATVAGNRAVLGWLAGFGPVARA